MKKLSLFYIKFFITLIIGLSFSYIYIQNFVFLESLNSKFEDMFFSLRGFEKVSEDIVIIDIDERSLSLADGFSRDKFAKVIDNLVKAEASVIGLDVTFSHKDKSSPKYVLDTLGIDSRNAQNYDNILASSFKKAPLISGYMFDFRSNIIKGDIPNISSIFVQKGYIGKEYLPNAKGIISNIHTLQNSSYSSGFFNLISDKDGVVRSLPLVMKYNETLYPSLALEIVRTLWNKKKTTIEYSAAGISEIRLDDFIIPTDRFGRLMINFKGKSKSYKYISAVDIYNNTFIKEEIKDKIVLIGASTSRFLDLRAIPFDSTFGGVEIHATAIDNIINQDFLIKPNWIEAFDIGILFILLFMVLIFSLFGPIKNAIFSLVIIFGFIYISFYLFVNYGLILGIVSPLIANFVLYSILTFLHYLTEVRQKEKLNKQLLEEMINRQKIIEDEVIQKTDDLQMALQEKTILLKELHHRVKNNLQLILSITRLQQYDIKDKKMKEELNKLQNRIKSIAKTHEMLCNSDDISNVDMSEYIGQLCDEMESGIVQSDIDIDLDISVTLPLREAVYVGLIVNELISNSLKHAFNTNSGMIYIFLSKIDGGFVLKVGDTGSGYDKKLIKHDSLGLKLVDSLVVNQLDGSIDLHTDGKFEYIIRF